MNIKIANRLLEFRKRSGLSQEELAEKLNITRQSVSKWERAESAPDTDNLIELAKIYGVTLDDLLNVDKPMEQTSEKVIEEVKITNSGIFLESNCFEDNKGDNIIISDERAGKKYEGSDDEVVRNLDELFIKKNGEKIKLSEAKEIFGEKDNSIKTKNFVSTFNGILILVIVLTYILLCSFNIQDFGKFWIIFVSYPMFTSLVEAIAYKNASKFAYPVFVTVVFLILGMYFDMWHPTWIVYITIPIYYSILKIFKKKVLVYFYDNNNVERHFQVNKTDIKFE